MSMEFGSRAGIGEASIEATVIRADGTVEELGKVAYYHPNPLRRAIWKLRKGFKRGDLRR